MITNVKTASECVSDLKPRRFALLLVLVEHAGDDALEPVLEVDDLGRLLHLGDHVERLLRLARRVALQRRRLRALRRHLRALHARALRPAGGRAD